MEMKTMFNAKQAYISEQPAAHISEQEWFIFHTQFSGDRSLNPSDEGGIGIRV